MEQLSPHFTKEEMACPHCGQCQLDPRLLPALEELRSLAAAPIVVHDAYRCEAHNLAVGGVPHSEHPLGKAADINIPNLSLQEQYDLAKQVKAFAEGGIGVYDTNFLHVDVRSTRARWARVHGRYVGIDALVRE